MSKTLTLFSRLTRDYDSGAVVVVLENLPFYRNATMTPEQLRRLAAKLVTIADETVKGDDGEFKAGQQMEQYYQVSSYENTVEFCESEDSAD